MQFHPQILNLVNGEFLSPQTNQWQPGFSPIAEGSQYQTPQSGALDVVKALQAANKASVLWQKSPLDKRKQFLFKIANRLREQEQELARLSAWDQGLPVSVALQKEIRRAIATFEYYAHLDEQVTSTSIARVTRSPLGVVAIITASHFPMMQLAREIAPALYCGNVMVIKPSSQTPQTPFALAHIFNEIELPKGVCNFVFGTGSEVGSLLASHPSTRAVAFTGRTENGAAIINTGAAHIKRTSFQLSGKNAALILEDADLNAAATRCARACFEGAGQSPFSLSRMIVPESRHTEFVELFCEASTALVMGDPMNAQTIIGPLLNIDQRQKIVDAVKQAVAEKGLLKTPPIVNQGLLITPQVIDDLHNCSVLQQEEITGPFVLIVPYKAAHEGVKWLNTTPYGICASIWSADQERALKLAANLEVATVWINDWDQWHPGLPSGGTKTSGLGRAGGEHSLNFYSEIKSIYTPGANDKYMT